MAYLVKLSGVASILKMPITLTKSCFYRPPASDASTIVSLCNALSIIGDGFVVVGGDFNLPDVRWLDRHPLTVTSLGVYSAVLNLINDYNLKQFVKSPQGFVPVDRPSLTFFLVIMIR